MAAFTSSPWDSGATCPAPCMTNSVALGRASAMAIAASGGVMASSLPTTSSDGL